MGLEFFEKKMFTIVFVHRDKISMYLRFIGMVELLSNVHLNNTIFFLMSEIAWFDNHVVCKK